MLPEPSQMLLPFPRESNFDARDFIPADSNRQALAWLDIDWPDRRLALWGPHGCGKSHLLHIWAQRVGAPVLPGSTLRDLDEVPESGGLALDDADAVTTEPLLLHLLNTARDRGLCVLLSGRTPPSRWDSRLPDLSSRLRAIATVEIRPPSDDLLALLLARLLSDRQLSVAQSVQAWLLTQIHRTPDALRQAVARLDDVSLTAGKPITRSLAAKVIQSDEFSMTAGDGSGLSRSDPSSLPPGFL